MWNALRSRRRTAAPDELDLSDVAPGVGLGVGANEAVFEPAHAVDLPCLPKELDGHVLFDEAAAMPFGTAAVRMGKLGRAAADSLAAQRKDDGLTVVSRAVARGLMSQEDADSVVEAHGLHVQVDQRHRHGGPFLTWLEDLQSLGVAVRVEPLSAQDLADRQRAEVAAQASGADERGLETLKLARRLFEDCAAMEVSDLHIVRRTEYTEIQVRINGDLRVLDSMSMRADEGDALIRSICSGLAGVKGTTFNPLDFQNAQISGDQFPGTGLTSVRVVRGPCYPVEAGCNFLVARLLYGAKAERTAGRILATRVPSRPDGKFDPLKLGFTPLQAKLLQRVMIAPKGIVLVVGPTGSGKTTTMFQLMKEQARLFPKTRHTTMEDPPEYPMPWAIQLASESERFKEMLKNFLRMDPDVMLVGELRDEAQVDTAFEAAQTGHFVWATLHGNDPFDAYDRLRDVAEKQTIEKLLASDTLASLISQRLVGILCPHCSRPFSDATEVDTPQFMREALKTWARTDRAMSRIRLEGPGCEHCGFFGTVQRVAVAEIVRPDAEFRRYAREKGVEEAKRWHRTRPGSDLSMLENAIPLVLAGKVAPMEIHRSVAEVVARKEQ